MMNYFHLSDSAFVSLRTIPTIGSFLREFFFLDFNYFPHFIAIDRVQVYTREAVFSHTISTRVNFSWSCIRFQREWSNHLSILFFFHRISYGLADFSLSN